MTRRRAVFFALLALVIGGGAGDATVGALAAARSRGTSAPARAAKAQPGLPADVAAAWRKPWVDGCAQDMGAHRTQMGCGALFDCLAEVFDVGDFEALSVGYYQGGALPERFRARVMRCSNAEAGPDQVRYDPTAAGDAAARAALITKADLPLRPGWSWSGTVEGQSVAAHEGCAAFHPRESDLVVTGDVAAVYTRAGFQFATQVQVYQSTGMLATEWRRSVQSAGAFECERASVVKAASTSVRVVSVRRLRLPRIATFTTAYRAIYDVTAKGRHSRHVVDFVYLGRGKTEISLVGSWPLASPAYGDVAEVRLARVLASRIRD